MKKIIPFLFVSFVFLISCEKETPEIPNEEEVITSLVLKLESTNENLEFSFVDEDGDGGNDPVITTDTLNNNTTYSGKLYLYNGDESINPEIEEEAVDHQFFFSSTNDLDISYQDFDMNQDPLGLEIELTTGDASNGTLTITLKHQPTKGQNLTLENAGGETDIEVTFNVEVK